MNINKLSDKLNFVVPLEDESKIMGVLVPINTGETGTPDYTLVSTQVITGTTTSKLQYIKKSYPVGTNYLGAPAITIRGTDIWAKITGITTEATTYDMYLETGFAIHYVDAGDITTFEFYPPATDLQNDSSVFMLAYWGLIDEPKLTSNLFINRGINNVFESFKRLKTIASLQELEKTGFGFFKLYAEGIT
jgi:hypothetical protein